MSELSLDQVPLFSSLPVDEVRLLGETLRHVDLPAQMIMMREGDYGEHLYVVLAGEIEVVKALGTDHERLLAISGPGEVVGEMSVLTHDRVRTASVRTRTPARLLEMSSADLDALLERQPRIAYQLLRMLSTRLRDVDDATIRDLQEKNRQLTQAYADLQAAQSRIVADVQTQARMDEEMRVARLIQRQFLPDDLPPVPGWRLAADYRPARAVGGDFYDVIPLTGGLLGLVIGDVSGKGVPAALIMARIQSVLRAEALHSSEPATVLEQVNRLIAADLPATMYVTCLYAVLDPAAGLLRYGNAGHLSPYMCTNGEVIELRARGTPFGWFPDMTYQQHEVLLPPDAGLLLHTDGLVEAHGPDGAMFGSARLRALLSDCRPDGRLLPQMLLERLSAFVGPGEELEDDVTLLHLQRTTSS